MNTCPHSPLMVAFAKRTVIDVLPEAIWKPARECSDAAECWACFLPQMVKGVYNSAVTNARRVEELSQ